MADFDPWGSFRKGQETVLAPQLAQMQMAGQGVNIAGALRKLQLENEFRNEISSAATPEARSAVAAKYASPTDIFKRDTESADQKSRTEATREMARMRIQQAASQFNTMMELRIRSAKTAEERLQLEQEKAQGMMQLQAEHARQVGAANEYNFGIPKSAVATPNITVGAPAAPVSAPPSAESDQPVAPPQPQGVTVAPSVSVAELMRLPPAERAIAMQGRVSPPLGQPSASVAPTAQPVAAAPIAAPSAQPAAPVPVAAVTTPPIAAMPPEIAALPKKKQDEWTAAQGKNNAGSLGNRESVFINRVILSGNEAAKDLSNVVKLPMTASTGLLGGRGQAEGILNAVKETLANKMTGQEAQSYNVLSAGFQRSLAAIESAGLAPSGTLSHQMDAVIFKEGDTNFTKLQKLAQTRQIVEAGLETIASNPRIPKETREHIGEIIKNITKSVPFTQSDLIALQQAQQINPKTTLKDIIGKVGASSGEWKVEKVSQ